MNLKKMLLEETVVQECFLVVLSDDYFDNCKVEHMALAKLQVNCQQQDKIRK